jgi:ribosomal protein S18 acetylase RimI-like enzyme
MYVSPDFRGKGINKALVGHLISWSKNKGAQAVYLDVYSENASAIKAYEKVGFEPSLLEMKLIL